MISGHAVAQPPGPAGQFSLRLKASPSGWKPFGLIGLRPRPLACGTTNGLRPFDWPAANKRATPAFASQI